MEKIKAFSVSQVNEYIKSIFEDDLLLSDLLVEAEISNFKRHTSGHLYFTLKDNYSSINCIMFKGNTYDLNFEPSNGIKVIAYGRVSVYEKAGQYQLYVEYLQAAGIGNLAESFESLKQKLSNEGLFEQKFKKEISTNPKCVAVITSQTGAAIRDILQIARRRNPKVNIVIHHVLVQGEDSGIEIAKAVKNVNEWGKADTIILGRGGGSAEDLLAFNEEIVVRAVFNSKIPVISAVGHETDFTLSDFVADMRAPTPSAAAELAIPSLTYKKELFKSKLIKLNKLIQIEIENKKEHKNNLQKHLLKEMEYSLNKKRMTFQNKLDKLESISTMAVLRRGYAMSYKKSELIKSIEQVQVNDNIKINFADGYVEATISKKDKV